MALFNYASKEITLKVVYYGPGLSGKTTNLQYLYPILDKERKSKLLSLSTEADRTLFFDFLPVELGKIKDFSIRFQLYTVPGQVRYNATRKLVLKGADAVVFVADSQKDMREQNMESFANMRENLTANNLNPDDIPLVLQFNKRDLTSILSVDELNKDLNINGYPYVSAEAINGTGVEETFQLVTKLLIKDISRKHKMVVEPAVQEAPEQVAEEAETAAVQGVIVAGIEGVLEEAPQAAFEETPVGMEGIAEEMELEGIEQEILRTSLPEETTGQQIPEEEIPVEKAEVPPEWQDMEARLNALTEMVNSVKDTVERVLRDVRDSRSEMSLKSFSKLSSSMENTLSELLKETKESKARQKEILDVLKELHVSISKIKGKKWFHLFVK